MDIDYKKYYTILENGSCECSICGKVFSKYGIKNHLSYTCLGVLPKNKLAHPAWNKGKTKDDDERIAKCGKSYHEKVLNGDIIPPQLGKPHTEETKKKISQSMKLAHSKGIAHNIGQSRWNNEPSYPEKWFMEVISNEFEDKNYIREYSFSKYSLDFAWIDKKLCIEIDGEQHQRFEEYIERDRFKDILLEKEGWKVLRMPWKEVYNNPKLWIEQAKSFIHE